MMGTRKHNLWHMLFTMRADKGRPHTLLMQIVTIFMITSLAIASAQYIYYTQITRQNLEKNAVNNTKSILAQCKQNVEDQMLAIFEQFILLKLKAESLLNVQKYSKDFMWDSDGLINLKKQMETIYIANINNIESISIYFSQIHYTQHTGLAPDEFYLGYLKNSDTMTINTYHWINPFQDMEAGTPVTREGSLGLLSAIRTTSGDIGGYILIRLKRAMLEYALADFTFYENGYFAIISDDGSMVFRQIARGYALDSDALTQLRSSGAAGTIETMNEKRSLTVIYDDLSLNGWKLAAIYASADILVSSQELLVFSATVSLLAFCGISAVFLTIRKQITIPAFKLANKVRMLDPHRYVRQEEEAEYKELSLIDSALDSMVVRIDDLIRRIQEEEEEKTSFELRMLQEQIKPHFLYNTLFAIEQLLIGDPASAYVLMHALAAFYRIGLNSGNSLLPLKQELELTEKYLYIQKMRYENLFDYDIQVDERLLHANIAKMSLQPIVENALYHGVLQKETDDEKGLITVRGQLENGLILLCVSDNGAGMDLETLERVRASLHENDPGTCFAIRNVNRRMQLYFGETFSLRIDSVHTKGTSVLLQIPFEGPNKR